MHDNLEDKDVEIIRAGKWWIAHLEELGIAQQGESEQVALDKLSKRLEKYRDPDIVLSPVDSVCTKNL